MILKGQNFRILTLAGSDYKCVGMATGCTVTLTSNTESAATKDDVGMADKPTVVSKSWTVSVDSLNVTDAAAILTAIKSLTPFTLMWDETSVTDNQTGEQAAFARTGQAYLNDATFNFNDRENSTKQLKFTGTGELSKITTTPTYEPVDASVYTKGQFVRLFLGSDNTTTPAAVIAAARQLSFHVSMSLENATTKDTPGDWQIQEPTGLSYDISSTALMRGNDTISSSVAGKSLADIEDIYEAGTPVKFQIANVSGDNQRTKGAVIVSGSVIIATLTLNGPNRQNADYTTALNGYGAYTVGA
jgi:predicted secreted protein